MYWITGGRGFIGSNLAATLSREAQPVVGIGHGALTSKQESELGFAGWLNSSVSQSSLQLLLSRYGSPEVIFHLAGGSSVGASVQAPYEDFNRTVGSTGELLEWIRSSCPTSKLVLASSAAVYGEAANGHISEESEAIPCSPYGYHKRCAELLVASYARNFGVAAVIVRLFSVYGPGLQKQLLWDIAQKVRNNKEGELTLGGTGEELRDFIFVEDAVSLLSRAKNWTSSSAPIFNGGTGRATSVRELAGSLLGELGSSLVPTFSGQARVGDPRVLVAATQKTSSLGFACKTDLKAGLRRTAEWLREVST